MYNLGVSRELEEDAKQDEDIAAILKGTGGDPELIKQRVSWVHAKLMPCTGL